MKLLRHGCAINVAGVHPTYIAVSIFAAMDCPVKIGHGNVRMFAISIYPRLNRLVFLMNDHEKHLLESYKVRPNYQQHMP